MTDTMWVALIALGLALVNQTSMVLQLLIRAVYRWRDVETSRQNGGRVPPA